MPKFNPDANEDDEQVDEASGGPVSVGPIGSKTEGEIDADKNENPDDAARIDPHSRIPRPVPPDLA